MSKDACPVHTQLPAEWGTVALPKCSGSVHHSSCTRRCGSVHHSTCTRHCGSVHCSSCTRCCGSVHHSTCTRHCGSVHHSSCTMCCGSVPHSFWTSPSPALPACQLQLMLPHFLRAHYVPGTFFSWSQSVLSTHEVQVLLLSPCDKCGNWGTEPLCDSPKSESLRNGAGTCTRLPYSTELSFPLWHRSSSFKAWHTFASPFFPRAALKYSYPSCHLFGFHDIQVVHWALHIRFLTQPPPRELLLSLCYVSELEKKSLSQDQCASKNDSPCSGSPFYSPSIFLHLSSLPEVIPSSLLWHPLMLVILTAVRVTWLNRTSIKQWKFV